MFNSDPCLAEARRDYKEFLELDPHSEYAADDKKELQSLPVVPVKPAVFTAAFQYCEKFRERKSWPIRRPGTQVLDLLFCHAHVSYPVALVSLYHGNFTSRDSYRLNVQRRLCKRGCGRASAVAYGFGPPPAVWKSCSARSVGSVHRKSRSDGESRPEILSASPYRR